MTTFNDDDYKLGYASSQTKKVVYSDDEHSYASSQSRQEETCQDGYDSDGSVTSRVHGCLQEGTTPCVDRQAPDLTFSQADESADTTWTDEKHSSYLDSMEATFVRKMYDKEYCSLDVCGHSYHSSVTLEEECVESQPFCLNMKKPYEQKLAGLLALKPPARPFSFVPSMFASPWIRHFKSQKKVSTKKAEGEDEAAQTLALHVSLSTNEEHKTKSITNAHSNLNEISSQSIHEFHRKRGALKSFSDSKYAATNFRGYTRTSLSHIAADYKRHKCQHSALSHLDILMEERYNFEQQSNLGADIGIEDGKKESKKEDREHHDGIDSCIKVVSVENGAVKEKQEQEMGTRMEEPLAILADGVSLHKLDQVVPLFQNVGSEEACEKSVLADTHSDEEDAKFTDSNEPENVTTRTSSKTWTWGIQGPRYHRIGEKAIN